MGGKTESGVVLMKRVEAAVNALNSFHQNNTKNGQERKSRTFEIITGEFSLFGRVRYGKEGSLALEISRSLGYGVNKTS